jgi:hypothetical protein
VVLLTVDRIHKAFHENPEQAEQSDICGYCGEVFSPSGVPCVEQAWEDRLRHIQGTHKFRECNSKKNFYRVDHFRQHLKHSHGAVVGAWTKMLEGACMMSENPVLGA